LITYKLHICLHNIIDKEYKGNKGINSGKYDGQFLPPKWIPTDSFLNNLILAIHADINNIIFIINIIGTLGRNLVIGIAEGKSAANLV